MTRRASAQTAHLHLDAIADDMLQLRGNQLRAVLEVSSVNLALQGDVEQEATIVGFAAFLNGLAFPVQLLVRAVPVDVAGYLEELERRAARLPETLADLARDHAAFLRRLARSRTLLERRFYVVVPAEVSPPHGGWWPFGSRPGPGVDLVAARKQLTFRCDEVSRQLGRSGLSARRLVSNELAELLYTCWCPDLARLQRLRDDLAAYATLVVRADRSRQRSDKRRH